MSSCNVCAILLTPENKVKNRRRCKECHKKIKKELNDKWYEKNPEKKVEYHQRYLVKRQVRIICECGQPVQVRDIKRHQQSKYHIEAVAFRSTP